MTAQYSIKKWPFLKSEIPVQAIISVMVVIAWYLLPGLALAAVTAEPAGTCTDGPGFEITSPGQSGGIISQIIITIQQILLTVTQQFYMGVITSASFVKLVKTAVTLYVMIYGILFMFGMVHITLFDFTNRMIKIGVVALLISPNSWQFFSGVVVRFFDDSTNQIINVMTGIALGIPTPNGPPFGIFDYPIALLTSSKLGVTLMAVFVTGPYGPLFGLLLVLSMGSFLKTLFTAITVYLMSMVLRTLLFSLAPLFIVCLLFNRTRHLFDGWLNQIVNACLQPILLFIFFAFFAQLIVVAINNILLVPVCWTEWADSVRGTPFHTHYWRFKLNGQPWGGLWTWTGPAGANGPIFPIDIMNIFIFFILAELTSKFNNVVIQIAADLAGASTNLANMNGAFGGWFQAGGTKEANPLDPFNPKGKIAENSANAATTRLAGLGGPAGGARGGVATYDSRFTAKGNRDAQEALKRYNERGVGSLTDQIAGMSSRRGGGDGLA